jgi:DNA-directed RNA polymerase subunit RPC12/RpoP
MVQYLPKQIMPVTTPVLRCGQCGSRRTEVIGMSVDLKTTYVRCSECGASGQVPARDAREAVLAQ